MLKGITKMKDLPEGERPYERFEAFGAGSLSDSELLGIILRSGSKQASAVELANKIYQVHPVYKDLRALNYLTIEDLVKIHGVGKVKAIQILCIAELSRRMALTVTKDQIRFNSPESIANYYMESTRYLRQEQMILMLFDTKNNLVKDIVISKGTVNSALVSPREVFIEAIRYEAVNIILLHNHPSGDPMPSAQDIAITRRVKEAGDIMGINLNDHIILGDQCYISLKERGIF